MKILRAVAIFFLAFLAGVPAQAADKPYYTATFSITLEKSGELLNFHLVEVLDPTDKRRTPLDIHPPQAYIDAAREQVLKNKYKPEIVEGHPKEFFTWFFYVPSQPDRVDLDPVKHR